MNNEKAKKILFNKRASKVELRQALAFMLGYEYEAETKEKKKTIHNECKDIFCIIYKNKTGLDYVFTGKDAGSLSQLIKKVEGILETVTEENILITFKALIERLPEWYVKNQFSLPIINSKFNEIVSNIKQDGKQQSGISESYKERVLREMRTNSTE